MSNIRHSLLTLASVGMTCVLATLIGCAGAQQKRKEQREKLAQSSKLYCEFLNGEQFPDIDVALNIQIAQKCDSDRSLSITGYKTPSDIPGVLFCCSTGTKVVLKPEAPVGSHAAPVVEREKMKSKPVDIEAEKDMSLAKPVAPVAPVAKPVSVENAPATKPAAEKVQEVTKPKAANPAPQNPAKEKIVQDPELDQ